MDYYWVISENWSGEICEATTPSGSFFGMLKYHRNGGEGYKLATFRLARHMEQFMDSLDNPEDEDTSHDL